MVFKSFLQLADFSLGPDATLNTEIHKHSVRIKALDSVNATSSPKTSMGNTDNYN